MKYVTTAKIGDNQNMDNNKRHRRQSIGQMHAMIRLFTTEPSTDNWANYHPSPTRRCNYNS